MDTAAIEGAAPPVHVAAQELRGWDPAEVKATEFRCTSCSARVFAKAFELNKQVQAHFSLYQHGEHDAGCPEGPVVVAATTGDDAAAGTLPTAVAWPTRLVEAPAERKMVDPAADLPKAADQRVSTRGEANTGVAGRRPSQSARAYSIRPFAHAFLRMDVEQRRHTPIELPGVGDADRYQFAFKRLPQWSIERLARGRRVFYGQLRFTANVEDTGSEYRIALHAGEWDSEQKKFSRCWELRVEHTGWTQRARTVFLDELESAVNQARAEKDGKKQPWVFALATQNPGVPGVIETSERRHVAFLPLDPEAAPK